MGYWLELGVAGFRVDAVPFVIEIDGAGKEADDAFRVCCEEMRTFLQWRAGDAILLGEANVLPPEHLKYFGGEGDRIHMMFNFFVNQHLFYALASGDVAPLVGGAARPRRSCRRPRSGRSSCAITTNSISAG